MDNSRAIGGKFLCSKKSLKHSNMKSNFEDLDATNPMVKLDATFYGQNNLCVKDG
jgi:hypothetical protein